MTKALNALVIDPHLREIAACTLAKIGYTWSSLQEEQASSEGCPGYPETESDRTWRTTPQSNGCYAKGGKGFAYLHWDAPCIPDRPIYYALATTDGGWWFGQVHCGGAQRPLRIWAETWPAGITLRHVCVPDVDVYGSFFPREIADLLAMSYSECRALMEARWRAA